MELAWDKPEAVLVKCEIDPLDMEVVGSQDVKVEPEDDDEPDDDNEKDVVNGEAVEESEKLAKNFSCQICNKTFTRNSNLKAHMRFTQIIFDRNSGNISVVSNQNLFILLFGTFYFSTHKRY
jgi:hypothetical protein